MAQAELFPTWRELVNYSSDGPEHKKLIETDEYKAVLVGLEAGQKIPPHPAAAAAYHFLDGTGWMVVDGERMHVKPGATVIVPQGVRRGVEAETRLAFLGSHGGVGATQESARPFLKGGLAALLGLMLMVGLMIVVPLLFSGSNPLAMMFASGLEPSLGMWGLMLLPFASLLVMVALMFAFFRLTSGRDGSMAKMMSRGGIMAPMMGHQHDHERGQHKGMPFTTDTYNIPSVNCGHCQMTIEKKVGELTGVASVHVDVDAKRAVIKYNSPATRSKIETLLVKIGHPPQRA